MPSSTLLLRGIATLVCTMIAAIPVSARSRCGNGMNCQQPVTGTNVSTVYRYRTVPRISNVNQYRNETRTSYHDITRTKYRDVHQVRYRDVTRTHYVRHINRIVTVTQVQPIVRVHTVTLVHHQVIARVHTRVIPRVHVAVIPRVHTRTVVLPENQYVSETRMLPTRTAMAGSRTVMVGTRTTQMASSGRPRLYNMAKSPKFGQ
jgi:hypothetical protein